MDTAIIRFFRKHLSSLFIIRQLIRLSFSKVSYIRTSGLLHTFKVGRPQTPEGQPLPWMNYNVIDFLRERLTQDMTLFEFGSGFSTFFFSKQVEEVNSVECDRAWYEKIHQDLPDNANLIYCKEEEDGEYCRTALATGQLFDIVLVDGRDRVNCLKNSCAALKDKGVILLDDSQREEYQEGIQFLRARGFKQIDFAGPKPVSIQLSRTSVFYRPENCLEL